MNYLFLDIDQVLNNTKSHNYLLMLYKNKITREELNKHIKIMPIEEYEKKGILNSDHVYIPIWKMLKDFIYKYNIQVVGISSWFVGHYNLNDLIKFLEYPIVGVTNYVGGGGDHRSDTILEYIQENKLEDCNYVVLDDIVKGYYLKNIVFVNGKVGLTEKNLIDASKFLK